MRRNVAIFGFLAAAIHLLPTNVAAAETSYKEMLTDPADGAFDMSRFIKTRTGFVPILAPVTEPAVGYGIAGGLVFFHRKEGEPPPDPPPAGEGRITAPSLTFIGGLATENGSWGVFGVHRGVWKGDRIRYLARMGYASLQLTFYGTAPQTSDISRDVELRTVPFLQEIAARIPGSDFFAGLRYAFVSSDIAFKPGEDIPGVTDREWTGNSKIGGLIPFLEYDSTDNFFTPGRGIHAKASLGFFDEIFGGDYDYRELHVKAVGYWPVLPNVVAGLRADGQFVAGDAPFYALPFVQLRGIPAMRYQGTDVLTLETEERWMVTPRWGLVGFAGIGKAADGFEALQDEETVWNVGGGFRYLTAREFGLQMGIDVARGPEQWAIYVVFGNSWN
ncbi:MAG: BamA/TamA family outer membrane protein [Deltaproteobacteria bacterium]|nr:BamA/TamA family outer membrane protein [Candidatus Deferrimicrobium borealis]